MPDSTKYGPPDGAVPDSYVGMYTLYDTIGEGSFAKVKVAVNRKTNERVAIKIMDKSEIKALEFTKQVRREIQVMSRLKHRHVVFLYEVMRSDTKLYIVMELVSGGELLSRLGRIRSETEARGYFQQIVDGVHYCHREGVAHRDLKAENVLLSADGYVKIGDFGFSSFVGVDNQTGLLYTQCGTPEYCAPEIIAAGSKRGYNGYKADVWSIGIILYALLCGRLPFTAPSSEALFHLILECNVPPYPRHLSRAATDLLDHLLVRDPAERYDLAMVKRHPWFLAGYDKSGDDWSVIQKELSRKRFFTAGSETKPPSHLSPLSPPDSSPKLRVVQKQKHPSKMKNTAGSGVGVGVGVRDSNAVGENFQRSQQTHHQPQPFSPLQRQQRQTPGSVTLAAAEPAVPQEQKEHSSSNLSFHRFPAVRPSLTRNSISPRKQGSALKQKHGSEDGRYTNNDNDSGKDNGSKNRWRDDDEGYSEPVLKRFANPPAAADFVEHMKDPAPAGKDEYSQNHYERDYRAPPVLNIPSHVSHRQHAHGHGRGYDGPASVPMESLETKNSYDNPPAPISYPYGGFENNYNNNFLHDEQLPTNAGLLPVTRKTVELDLAERLWSAIDISLRKNDRSTHARNEYKAIRREIDSMHNYEIANLFLSFLTVLEQRTMTAGQHTSNPRSNALFAADTDNTTARGGGEQLAGSNREPFEPGRTGFGRSKRPGKDTKMRGGDEQNQRGVDNNDNSHNNNKNPYGKQIVSDVSTAGVYQPVEFESDMKRTAAGLSTDFERLQKLAIGEGVNFEVTSDSAQHFHVRGSAAASTLHRSPRRRTMNRGALPAEYIADPTTPTRDIK